MWRRAVWERSCDKWSDREAVQVAGTNEVTSPSFILSTLSHLLKLLWAHFLSSVVFIARPVWKCKPCRAMPIFLKPGSIFTCFAVLIIYTHQKLWNRSNRSAQRLHCDPASVFLSEVFILSFFPPVCCSLINAPVFLSALPPFNYSFIHPLSLFLPSSSQEMFTGGVFLVMVLLWLTRSPGFMPGWASLLPQWVTPHTDQTFQDISVINVMYWL